MAASVLADLEKLNGSVEKSKTKDTADNTPPKVKK